MSANCDQCTESIDWRPGQWRNEGYTYGSGGNLSTRLDRTPNPDVTWTYAYDTPNHYHAVKTITGDATPASFGYDANGNMTGRTVNAVTYTQGFDVENRLKSVTVNGQTTTFYYDADGNRILTVNDDGTTITKTYTPFPEYEEMVVGTTSTQRRHYYLAGQLIAVRVRTGTTGTGTLSFAFNDHLGSVAAWANSTGVYIGDSSSRYEPYGGYRVKPVAAVNPAISDRGFTGHKQNNTGTYDLGLIYMNARYYMPEIGRFISADTIVPDPKIPQSHNRYAYVLNSPVNFTDPSGHLTEDEVQEYFGFDNQEAMIEAGWLEELVAWLWDPNVTWGDVFSYNAGEAMLVLFETSQSGSGKFQGGFYGLNGERQGTEVYRSNIKWLNDHTKDAIELEQTYQNSWSSMPIRYGSDGTPYYVPTTFVNLATKGVASTGLSMLGGAALAGCSFAPPCTVVSASIFTWFGAGATVGGFALAVSDLVSPDITLTGNYPTMMLPSLTDPAPWQLHVSPPTGLYQ